MKHSSLSQRKTAPAISVTEEDRPARKEKAHHVEISLPRGIVEGGVAALRVLEVSVRPGVDWGLSNLEIALGCGPVE